MIRVTIRPAAREDIRGIWRYTVRIWGSAQAESYSDAIDSAIRQLAEEPPMSSRCDWIRANYVRKLAGSHYVFAIWNDRELVVVRVLHERMNFSSHLE